MRYERNPRCLVLGCTSQALCRLCYEAGQRSRVMHEARLIGRRWALDLMRLHQRSLRDEHLRVSLHARGIDLCKPWPIWGKETKVASIARRKVAHLASDPRLIEELAGACSMEAGQVWSHPEDWLGPLR